MIAALTRRQQAIFEHLRDYGYERPPTFDELCRNLGLRSRGSMHKHIHALIRAGLVEPMAGKQRGIRLATGTRQTLRELPWLGYIAAGRPVEALENPEALEVPGYLRSNGDCYVLRVKGDSMVEDGILDGDWVVIEKRSYARDGEIVVALIDGDEATLKRIEQKPGRCVLYPANCNLEPMVYPPERIQIQGVVVGQMRSYR